MSLVTTTTFPDDDGQPGVGEVAGFKKLKKGFKKITKPIGRIVKPVLSMVQANSGLLTALGPWGMAAGAALQAGGALADRHRQKKMKKKQKRAQRAAMAQTSQAQVQPPEAMAMMPAQEPAWASPEMMAQPPAMSEFPSTQVFPAHAQPTPMTEPFVEIAPPSVEPPPSAVMVLPSDEPPEFHAVLDPEPVTMAGLGNAPGTVVGIDWRALSALAGFTLGTWWLLRDRRPSPRSRRR